MILIQYLVFSILQATLPDIFSSLTNDSIKPPSMDFQSLFGKAKINALAINTNTTHW